MPYTCHTHMHMRMHTHTHACVPVLKKEEREKERKGRELVRIVLPHGWFLLEEETSINGWKLQRFCGSLIELP